MAGVEHGGDVWAAVNLRDFVTESNRIESIIREPTSTEIEAHRVLLALDYIPVEAVERFVYEITGKLLRDKPGMDVRVGAHMPPRGGPAIRAGLGELLDAMRDGPGSPYECHIRYETLHPFMDGNGRSGRALWAWQMQRDGLDPFHLPFLHRFYYQSLDASEVRA